MGQPVTQPRSGDLASYDLGRMLGGAAMQTHVWRDMDLQDAIWWGPSGDNNSRRRVTG